MQNPGQAKFFAGCGFVMMFVLFGLGCALALFGINELKEAREFPKPQSIRYADLVRARPEHGWFEVADGVLDVRNAVWEETIGTGII